MSDDEYDDDETEADEEFDADLDDADLEDDDDELVDDPDVLVDEELVAVDVLPVVEVDDDSDDEAEEGTATAAKTEDDEEIIDLDEELHPDDVEEALDVVLRERTAKARLEDEEEDEDEPDDRGEGGTRIVPRRENEFLCKSCFLVLPRHQLADEERMLCRDCA